MIDRRIALVGATTLLIAVSLACMPAKAKTEGASADASHLFEFLTIAATGATSGQLLVTDAWSQMDDRDTLVIRLDGQSGTQLVGLVVKLERIKVTSTDGPQVDSMNPNLTTAERWVDVSPQFPLPLSLHQGPMEVWNLKPGALVRVGKGGDSLSVVGLRVTATTSAGRTETRVLKVFGPD
jgi:hypothetical protein